MAKSDPSPAEPNAPGQPNAEAQPKADPPANPDRAALMRVGKRVRARLANDPALVRIPVDQAEMFAMAGFLTPAECDRFIAMIDTVAKPSTLYAASYDSGVRTSYSGDVDPSDPFVRMVTRRLDDLLGLDGSWGETVQGQRYLTGQEFKLHCDWFPTDIDYWTHESRQGGQRSWTAMVYLNDVEEGGATEFPYLDHLSWPARGSLLVWNNISPDGEPNVMTLHSGNPVVRGTKYVITKWYRTRRWGVQG
ncbi:MAG: 2OG-Fe(II) oxygenase superfamily protein [Novosphingobium sp.]|nr:2OG-Fe(II) oxygenase superfamily protein [Novosphingobium sp.]